MTIEDSLFAEIRRRMRERGTTFKDTVNELIRRGLQSNGDAEPYVTPTFRMGARPDVDLDKALALAGALEDGEVLHELERGR